MRCLNFIVKKFSSPKCRLKCCPANLQGRHGVPTSLSNTLALFFTNVFSHNIYCPKRFSDFNTFEMKLSSLESTTFLVDTCRCSSFHQVILGGLNYPM